MALYRDGYIHDTISEVRAQQSIRRKVLDREPRSQLSHNDLSFNDLSLLAYAEKIKKYL